MLVETGATLNAAFMQSGLVEHIHWFEAQSIFGDGSVPAFAHLGQVKDAATDEIFGFHMVDKRAQGDDTYMEYNKITQG